MAVGQGFTYQVVATGIGVKTGHVLRARLGAAPFLIGSGDNADLKLEGDAIQDVHARLVVTSKGQVLLINLGAQGTILLNGEPMAAFTPAYWKPGLVAQLGDYELQLEALDVEGSGGQLERVRPALITQDSAPVQPSPPPFIIDWGSSHEDDEAIHRDEVSPAVPTGQGTVRFTEQEILADLDEDTQRHQTEPMEEALAVGSAASSAVQESSELARTPVQPFPLDVKAYMGAPVGNRPLTGETLPKDWHQAGRLSGQLTINPVNLVAGERVRVPVSVRNGYDYPVRLRVYTAGLPREWILLPQELIELAPGEVSAFDIILESKMPPPDSRAELMIRLSDPSSPDIVLMLQLQVVFKEAPNLSGWLEPRIARHDKPVYLHLQNHTQATATVFIAGHNGRGLHVLPSQTQLDIPSGQVAKVPIKVDVEARPLLRPARHTFSVSVSQGSRAPLDYPGVVWVGARAPLLPALLGLAVMVVVGLVALALITRGSPTGGVQPVPNTQTTAPRATAAQTNAPGAGLPIEATEEASPTSLPLSPTPTRTPSETPTETPTSTPQLPTETPTNPPAAAAGFADPRPAGCSVPIPEGWKPYTVQKGDRTFRLALERGTTVDEIARVNCLENPRLLHVGNVLLLPSP